jgi:RHS repeat-associated protein
MVLKSVVGKTGSSSSIKLYVEKISLHRLGHPIAETDSATGASLREYIWLPSTATHNDTPAEAMGLSAANDNVPDLPLAGVNVSATPTLFHIHADHLGRPIRMTDATKTTVWAATWKPWGEPQSITGTQANNLRFPGQYFQIETGLAYNWYRHYDPVTGRYTQPDPLRFVDGPSVYAYAGSSPWMRTDREGKEYWPLPGGGRIYMPDGTARVILEGLLDKLIPRNSPAGPQMCSTPSEDQALAACLAAASGRDRTWLNFCDASKWAGGVDHTRPQRCRNYVNSSPVERANFCYNEFGD